MIPAALPSGLGWRSDPADTFASGIPGPSGIPGLDAPRGRITLITGKPSSGRTSLLNRFLANSGQAFKGLIDAANSFDPLSASESGVNLDRLVWVRCANNIDNAFKSTDLLLNAGSFGIVALDLCDVPARALSRIPLSHWYRFQRAVEKTSTIFLILSGEAQGQASVSRLYALDRIQTIFTGSAPLELLSGARFQAGSRKPFQNKPIGFHAAAVE